MNKHRVLTALILLLALLAASCGSGTTVDSGDSSGDGSSPTIAGRWVLDTLTIDGIDVPVLDDLEMTIDSGTIRGTGGCNSFGGTIDRRDDGSVVITDLAMTEMACEEVERMNFEGRYARALSEVDRWVVGPALLTLGSPNATLIYVPADPIVHASLEGTSWTLDTIFSGSGADGAASSTDQTAGEATMTIAAQRVEFASEACETLQVAVEHGGDDADTEGGFSLSDADLLDVTPCDDPNWNALISGASGANGFEIGENRLILHADDNPLIGFRAS